MHLSIDLFNPPWREILMMAASLKKADVLFAVSALSDGFFDNNEDRHAYTQVIEEEGRKVQGKLRKLLMISGGHASIDINFMYIYTVPVVVL